MIQLKELLTTELLSKLENIKKLMNNIAGKTKIYFPTFTNHGTDHLKNVEKYVNHMIPDEIKKNLTCEEIFFLLSAVWLHDVGMVPKDDEELLFFKNLSPEKRKEFTANIRKLHHIRSENYIKENFKELGLSKLEAKIIGQIAKGHRKIELNSYEDMNYNGVNIPIANLAAILRLADECDVSKDRESKLSSIDVDEKIRKEHYRKHEIVNHVWFDHEPRIIYISCIIENESDYESLNEVKKEIEIKLDQTKDYLCSFGIILNNVEFDDKWNTLIEKDIISYIADEKYDLKKWEIKNTTQKEIKEILCNLRAEGLFKNDNYSDGFKKDYATYKTLFKKFGGSSNFKKFFYKKYSQDMIPACYKELETKFYAPSKENRESRIEILKNTPTAFYFMLKFEEFLDDKNFNDETKVGGLEMVDFLLLMSLFNDINYYKEQIRFEEIEDSIKYLIRDENEVLDLLQKYKNEGEINKTDGSEEIRPISLLFKTDNYDKSQTIKTELDLVDFRKIMVKRSIEFDLELNELFKEFSKLMNPLPSLEPFDLKIGGGEYKSIEFLKNKISSKQMLFINNNNTLSVLLRIRINIRESDRTKVTVEVCEKSERIKDISNWLKFVSENSENNFELKYNNETIGIGKIPKLTIDPKLIKLYDDVDKFNDKYNLEMTHEYDYEIQGEDFGFAEYVHSIETTHEIKGKGIDVNLKIKISELKNLLEKDYFKLNLTYEHTPIKFLNNSIDLGKRTVSIEKAEIRNKKELKETVESHNIDDVVTALLYIKDYEDKDIILDFSSNFDDK